MDVKQLSRSCVDSITSDTTLKAAIQSSDELTRRAIVASWFTGYRSSQSSIGGDRGGPNVSALPDANSFIENTLPELRKVAA